MRLRLRLLFSLLGWCLAQASAAASETGALAAVSTTPFHIIVAPQTLRSDRVTLLWDQIAKPGSALTYEISCDGQLLATTTKTHFTAQGLAPDRDHVFAVRTRETPGHPTRRTAPLTVHTTPTEPVVSVEAFGARGDGRTTDTRAIQAAIDACPAGGVVLIPRGVFLSGALFLKSDMTLEVAAGGTLQGSSALADYEPPILNRFEGWELKTYASLLNAGRLDHAGPPNVRHLSIRGAGRIAGGGAPLAKAMIAAQGMRSRGRLLCLMNCADLEIQGLTLETPPSWTLHYLYCERVTCHDLTINTAILNGDGIDPDSSRDSYIVNCRFDTGDDCIAIKSGKNPEGNAINRPTENVWIVDCQFLRGHGISIGSEMSGGIRHVLVQDCAAGPLLHGFQIKATKDRGNVVEDVTVRDCDLQTISILTALNYNNDGVPAAEPPFFRNFHFVNLDLTTGKPGSPVIVLHGFSAAGHRTCDVTFDHVKLPAGAIVEIDEAEDVTFTEVTTPGGTKPTYAISHSDRIAN